MRQDLDTLKLLPAPAIMTAIFILSSMSALPHIELGITFTDKIEHLIAYSALAFFTGFWLPGRWKEKGLLSILILAAFASLYGITDEWHQSFVPNREVSALDWLADTVGGFLGGSLSMLRARPARQPQ